MVSISRNCHASGMSPSQPLARRRLNSVCRKERSVLPPEPPTPIIRNGVSIFISLSLRWPTGHHSSLDPPEEPGVSQSEFVDELPQLSVGACWLGGCVEPLDF